VRERFTSQGLTLPLGTPEEFTAYIAAETKRWGDIIRRGGIKME
jgi:tripartite-type tricarboxylate transporter receptor subunit TctC